MIVAFLQFRCKITFFLPNDKLFARKNGPVAVILVVFVALCTGNPAIKLYIRFTFFTFKFRELMAAAAPSLLFNVLHWPLSTMSPIP
ncbi:MAG: hypothetical protein IJT97_09495, partial [Bacteroidaceae bacterium]|nr:hypothetical protein [Bacteroidaceae bacterium]